MAIVAVGSTVYPAIAAAERLKEQGINVRVINARFIKPLDEKLLCDTAKSLKRIITVEENVLMGGFGSAMLELLVEKGIGDAIVKRLGIKDEFVEHASQGELRKMHGIDEEGIMEAAHRMMDKGEYS
jgi:1-deoxy-D-xylulose-5-phosphate synthase